MVTMATRPFPLADDETVAVVGAPRRLFMPSLIDPPSVSVSGRSVPALSPFRPVPPSPPLVCRARHLRRSAVRAENHPAAARYRQRGQPRPRKVTGARCRSREEFVVRSHTLLSRSSFSLSLSPLPASLPLFFVSLAGARMGLVLSRRYAARHPRKSTTGGRSRTVAPEP